MKRHRTFWYLFGIGGLLLLGAALAGCRPDTTAPELQQVAQAEQLTPPSASTDVEAGTTDAALVEFTDQACLTCHTNQDILKALAVEEEKVSLSSGPG